jgi:hypothetical protein
MAYSKQTSPFLNHGRRAIRIKRLSRSTEKSYMHYIMDFIFFHGKRHPEVLGETRFATISAIWHWKST